MNLADQQDWFKTGRHGGAYIDSAFNSLETVVSTATLVVAVLDAASGDSQLSQSIELRELFEDIKLGRLGQEWRLEGAAIANQQAEDFRVEWPKLRAHVLENQIVALCSATEQFVKMVLVEFPPVDILGAETLPDALVPSEALIERIDDIYRKRVKKLQSASESWVSLCLESGAPANIKTDVAAWGNSPAAQRVDALVLLRNQLIHAGGIVSSRFANKIGGKVGARVQVSQAGFQQYANACTDFALRICPLL